MVSYRQFCPKGLRKGEAEDGSEAQSRSKEGEIWATSLRRFRKVTLYFRLMLEPDMALKKVFRHAIFYCVGCASAKEVDVCSFSAREFFPRRNALFDGSKAPGTHSTARRRT